MPRPLYSTLPWTHTAVGSRREGGTDDWTLPASVLPNNFLYFNATATHSHTHTHIDKKGRNDTRREKIFCSSYSEILHFTGPQLWTPPHPPELPSIKNQTRSLHTFSLWWSIIICECAETIKYAFHHMVKSRLIVLAVLLWTVYTAYPPTVYYCFINLIDFMVHVRYIYHPSAFSTGATCGFWVTSGPLTILHGPCVRFHVMLSCGPNLWLFFPNWPNSHGS